LAVPRPERVKLAGIVLDVAYINGETPEYAELRKEATKITGRIHLDRQRMAIDEATGPDIQKETVIHEVCHGILQLAGHDPDDEREALVQALGTGLLQFIRDNPHVIRWLEEAERWQPPIERLPEPPVPVLPF
jgi:hypothetical protein